jgi:hypothetical protein
MEIDANMSWGAVNGLPPATRTPTGAKPVAESDSFASSNALEAALKNAPDTRAEALDRGRALVSNSDYPSSDTVKKLSEFLAGQMQSSPD